MKSRCRPIPWGQALIICLASLVTLAGCYRDPNPSKIICTTGDHCPKGYYCSLTGSEGTCKALSKSDSGSIADSGGDRPGFDRPATADHETVDANAVEGKTQTADASSAVDIASDSAPAQAADVPLGPPDLLASDSRADTSVADLPADTVPPDVMGDARADTSDLSMTPVDAPLAPPADTAPACTGECCRDSDCGPCKTCSSAHLCINVISAEDPVAGRCAGICDASGVCKSKRGQSCQTVPSGCVDGSPCVDGYCCDRECSGTCEACDVPASPGKCTILSLGSSPHAGHGVCIASDAICAGKCNGTSRDCFYPSTTCKASSCTSSSYQPAATCNSGACVIPASEPCPTGQTCSNGTCACISPKTICSGTCVDLQTDLGNCGSCDHSCLGGGCASGLCKPIKVKENLNLYSYVFGLDSQYIYYSNCSDLDTCTPSRIEKTAIGGAGAELTTFRSPGIGVIGNTLLLSAAPGQTRDYLCDISTTCTPLDPEKQIPSSPQLALFKSPPPPFFIAHDWNATPRHVLMWYSPSNTLLATAYLLVNGDAGLNNPVTNANALFWIEATRVGEPEEFTNVRLYMASNTIGTTSSTLIASLENIKAPMIVDANAQSTIVQDLDANSIYRVPLPGGLGTGTPQLVAGPTATAAVTEDTNGIYWLDNSGALHRCQAPACTGDSVLATDQAVGLQRVRPALYQDGSALYWVNKHAQLIRLAK